MGVGRNVSVKSRRVCQHAIYLLPPIPYWTGFGLLVSWVYDGVFHVMIYYKVDQWLLWVRYRSPRSMYAP